VGSAVYPSRVGDFRTRWSSVAATSTSPVSGRSPSRATRTGSFDWVASHSAMWPAMCVSTCCTMTIAAGEAAGSPPRRGARGDGGWRAPMARRPTRRSPRGSCLRLANQIDDGAHEPLVVKAALRQVMGGAGLESAAAVFVAILVRHDHHWDGAKIRVAID